MRAAALALAATAFLAACAGPPKPEPRIVTQTVEVPVPTPCAADPGPPPALPDTDAAIAAAPDIFQLAKLYAAGRQQRLDWEARLWAALVACRAAPVQPDELHEGAKR